jgi:maltose/moltooligosaccharide transporter
MKPKLSFAQLWNMNFGFLGIQFGWGLQLANISAIYAKLGADPDKIPLLWLAGPVTGLLVQPIVGAMSDRTWGWLGRRRPYFLAGSILATVGLFFLPNVHSLMAAAALLWVLDASINVSMEPFRAFVADKVNDEQRTVGFVMQSFFIGIGATLANLLPYAMRKFGVDGATTSGVPLTVLYSFRLGAVVLLLAVLWTVCTSTEYPPEAGVVGGSARVPLLARGREAAGEVFAALREMPATMKQLALVQVFTWLGLFCMWMYFGLMTATNVFGATDSKSPAFDKGIEWGGVCFAAYSIVCFAAAFALPKLAERVGRRAVHATALAFGGVSLLAVRTIHDPKLLLLTMVGVGIAWASILSMPYAILSGSLEPRRFGVFMGIFNFFIVLPEMIAALTFRPLVKYAFHNNPVYVVMLGGACLLVGAVLVVRVAEEKKGAVKKTAALAVLPPPESAPASAPEVPLEPAA